MSKKMKIPSIFKHKEAKQPWQWPSCTHPKTLSFRACKDDVFKTVNSIFLDPSDGIETPESWFTNSSESPSFSTDEHSEGPTSESLETIIQGLRSSERLFFDPKDTSSILKESKTSIDHDHDHEQVIPFKESVALAFESDDPYLDFKKSMQEMVESHGIKDWDCLEELLAWYLQMNGKINHGFIVGAFVDMLIGLASSDSSSEYSSADSSFSSPISQTSLDKERDVINIVQS